MQLKNATLTEQLSIAVGILAFIASIIIGLAPLWGFVALGQQLSGSLLVVSGAINLYFLGNTVKKITERNSDETKTK